MSTPYVSGGLDPNYDLTCGSCAFLRKDPKTSSHGWCPAHQMASVSITGGCKGHSNRREDVYQAALKYAVTLVESL